MYWHMFFPGVKETGEVQNGEVKSCEVLNFTVKTREALNFLTEEEE